MKNSDSSGRVEEISCGPAQSSSNESSLLRPSITRGRGGSR